MEIFAGDPGDVMWPQNSGIVNRRHLVKPEDIESMFGQTIAFGAFNLGCEGGKSSREVSFEDAMGAVNTDYVDRRTIKGRHHDIAS